MCYINKLWLIDLIDLKNVVPGTPQIQIFECRPTKDYIFEQMLNIHRIGSKYLHTFWSFFSKIADLQARIAALGAAMWACISAIFQQLQYPSIFWIDATGVHSLSCSPALAYFCPSCSCRHLNKWHLQNKREDGQVMRRASSAMRGCTIAFALSGENPNKALAQT